MKFKTIGRTGVQVSSLCLGTMTFGQEADEEISGQIFRRSREAGVNFIDTADVYSQGRSEEILGRLIREERDQLVLASKFQGKTGPGVNDRGCSRRHILRAVEATLKRLGTDRLELYYVHNSDPLTPIEETLSVLNDLVRAGKILYPAISNAPAWQIAKALGISAAKNEARFECVQPMYSLVKRQAEVELLPMAQSEQLGVVSYSPLGAGLLTGKYAADGEAGRGRIATSDFYRVRYDDPEYYETARKFCEFCRARDWHPATVAVAWTASHPAVTAPILGARNLEQLEPSLAAADFEMTTELRAEISALSKEPPLATDRRDEQFGMKIH